MTALDTRLFTTSVKLPDDMEVPEFASLMTAVSDLTSWAAWAHNTGQSTAYNPPGRLVRVQYGSDFLVVLAVAGGISTILLALSKSVKHLADAAYSNARAKARLQEAEANIRKSNAESALLESEFRRAQINVAADVLGSTSEAALSVKLGHSVYDHAGNYVGQDLFDPGNAARMAKLARSAARIARYRPSMSVEE
ncbi:hypothetical protein G3H63_09235 [Microbacterium resistens]|nr:hypothetical protein [Microbacterium resistens]